MNTRILIAANPFELASFVRWLDPHYDVLSVTAMEQALQFLTTENNIALFLIGAHFDDSQAVELINAIRSTERYFTTPIIVVRTIPSEYVEVLKQTFTVLKTLKGIAEYLDFDNDGDAGPTVSKAIKRALQVGTLEKVWDA